jgi:hypothetical protein
VGAAQPGRLGLGNWRDCCVNLYKEGLLMTKPNLQNNAVERDWPLTIAQRLAASKQDDKAASCGKKEPANTGSA